VTSSASLKLLAALSECQLHAEVLSDAAHSLPAHFEAADVLNISAEVRRTLDQLAYRFMKLQDALGEKVLPGLLVATLDSLPPHATFAEKLQRLERLGALPSADAWRLLREVRNGLAHEYPENPALQAAALTRLLGGARELIAVWRAVRTFVDTRLNLAPP
jgi:hypothetical protein